MVESVIKEAINKIFIYTDNREWDKLHEVFTDKVDLDYSSFTGGEPSSLYLEQILSSWKSLLPGFDATHHQTGNMQVDVYTETSAHAFCYGTALHYIKNANGGDTWIVVGSYDFHLVKAGGTWKADKMKFNFKFQNGNLELPKIAADKVKKLKS